MKIAIADVCPNEIGQMHLSVIQMGQWNRVVRVDSQCRDTRTLRITERHPVRAV